MERKIEDSIKKNMQAMSTDMNERLKEISSTSVGIGSAARIKESVERRLLVVENRLESIAVALGVTVQTNACNDEAAQKWLKERLKEVTEVQQRKQTLKHREKETWMEYIFGICESDGRVGKRESRCFHACHLNQVLFDLMSLMTG